MIVALIVLLVAVHDTDVVRVYPAQLGELIVKSGADGNGVTQKRTIFGFEVIAVVTPVEMLSIGLSSDPVVVIVNELVVEVVLGFYKPSKITVNGVNKEVQAVEKALLIDKVIAGVVVETTQATCFSPPIFTLHPVKLVLPVGKVIEVGKVISIFPLAGIVLLGVSCKVQVDGVIPVTKLETVRTCAIKGEGVGLYTFVKLWSSIAQVLLPDIPNVETWNDPASYTVDGLVNLSCIHLNIFLQIQRLPPTLKMNERAEPFLVQDPVPNGFVIVNRLPQTLQAVNPLQLIAPETLLKVQEAQSTRVIEEGKRM